MIKVRPEDIAQMQLRSAVKRPIPIRCVQMEEPFEVETMEGKLRGKAGDWLMIGVEGEMYPCDAGVFERTYDLIDK